MFSAGSAVNKYERKNVWDQKEITIHESSGETLTNYQVFEELSGSDFPTKVQSDGDDIRFLSSLYIQKITLNMIMLY